MEFLPQSLWTHPYVAYPIGLLLLFVGLYVIMGVLLDQQWFWQQRDIAQIQDMFGRDFGRVVLGMTGLGLVLAGSVWMIVGLAAELL